jgi:hypothetical protein
MSARASEDEHTPVHYNQYYVYRAFSNCCSSTATTLEAFRHNPANVASYQCPLGQVLGHWFVPVVPLVLHRYAISTV